MAEVAVPVPWWVEILELAQEWGRPPWELVREGNRVLWILRHRGWSSTIDSARREKSKHDNK